MDYRHLGRTGLRVSELSYGSWVTFSNQLDVRRAMECLRAAYDLVVTSLIAPRYMPEARPRKSWGGHQATGLATKHLPDFNEVLLGAA